MIKGWLIKEQLVSQFKHNLYYCMRAALCRFSWLSLKDEAMCFSNKCEGCCALLFVHLFVFKRCLFKIHPRWGKASQTQLRFSVVLHPLEKPKSLSVFSRKLPKPLILVVFFLSSPKTLSWWILKCWCSGHNPRRPMTKVLGGVLETALNWMKCFWASGWTSFACLSNHY